MLKHQWLYIPLALIVAMPLVERAAVANDDILPKLIASDAALSNASYTCHETNKSFSYQDAVLRSQKLDDLRGIKNTPEEAARHAASYFKQASKGNVYRLEYDQEQHYNFSVYQFVDHATDTPDSMEAYDKKNTVFLYPSSKTVELIAADRSSFGVQTEITEDLAPFPYLAYGRGLSRLANIKVVKSGAAAYKLTGNTKSGTEVSAILDEAHGFVAKSATESVDGKPIRQWSMDQLSLTPNGIWIAKRCLRTRLSKPGYPSQNTQIDFTSFRTGSDTYKSPALKSLTATWALSDGRLSVPNEYKPGHWTPDFDKLLSKTQTSQDTALAIAADTKRMEAAYLKQKKIESAKKIVALITTVFLAVFLVLFTRILIRRFGPRQNA